MFDDALLDVKGGWATLLVATIDVGTLSPGTTHIVAQANALTPRPPDTKQVVVAEKLPTWASSPLEFLARRYNIPTQQAIAWSGSLLKIVDVGAKWAAIATLLATFTGLSLNQGILITGRLIHAQRAVVIAPHLEANALQRSRVLFERRQIFVADDGRRDVPGRIDCQIFHRFA